MKTSIVIPVSSKAQDGYDIDRLQEILLPSLSKYVDPDVLAETIVICREADTQRVNAPDCTIITDEQMLGPLNAVHRDGWIKQQVLKLLVHKYVSTDTYLVLDADCFAARPIGEWELLPGGKARLGIGKPEVRDEWWAISAETMLHHDCNPPEWPYIGVTPQILYRHVCKGLLEYLKELHQKDPVELLTSHIFTEFTLYWRYMLEVGIKPESLYHIDPCGLRLSAGVWTDSENPVKSLEDLLVLKDFCFGIVQSVCGVIPRVVLDILEEAKV